MNSEKQTAYIGIGTNLGKRAENIEKALEHLSKHTTILRCSSIYETKPIGYTKQRNFFNMVAAVETTLEPLLLLEHLKNIEQEMGRVATFRNGPRVIDLDVLLYGGIQVHTKQLVVPHPSMCERDFVFVPLAEILDKTHTSWFTCKTHAVQQSILSVKLV